MSLIEQATKRLEELRRTGVGAPLSSRSSLVNSRVAQRPAASADVRGRVDRDKVRSQTIEIDLEALQARGFIVGNSSCHLADQMRVIKRPLIKNASAVLGKDAVQRSNLIEITSAQPGEGKTFCAINLAISIAMEVDLSVLLVDADIRRPSLPERLGIPPGRGLMDALRDPSLDLSELLLRTNLDKLSLLLAGTPGANSTELLASAAMDQLLDDLAVRYADRIVVFDAPPLLPTTESRVLASRVGQVVVVVDSYRTPQTDVRQAFAALESCPIVMSILNRYCGSVSGAYGHYRPEHASSVAV